MSASHGVILGLMSADNLQLGLISAMLDFHQSGIFIVQIFWGSGYFHLGIWLSYPGSCQKSSA